MIFLKGSPSIEEEVSILAAVNEVDDRMVMKTTIMVKNIKSFMGPNYFDGLEFGSAVKNDSSRKLLNQLS